MHELSTALMHIQVSSNRSGECKYAVRSVSDRKQEGIKTVSTLKSVKLLDK
jgi:t-SNARE complex subunit (syntaxin)